MEKNEIKLKILGLGDSIVGQTCILRRYIENKYEKNYLSTIGIDFKKKNINLNKGIIKLTIWETEGQERFRSIITNYLKGPDALILIYDVTNKSSYDSLNGWVNFIKHGREESTITIPVILVGNKIDLEYPRKVTREEGYKFANENGFLFVECSAKTGENINDIFNKLVLAILENNPKYEELKEEFKNKVRMEIEEFEEELFKMNKKLKILKKYISF